MLTSFALIFLLGMSLSSVFSRLRLPSLIGLLIAGIILGPYAFDLLDESILAISADLRKLALIIILIRAGLSLDVNDLKKVGRPAVLMCFVPACFEILGMILIAPKILNIFILDAAIMGAVVGAVSPAVVVPKMLDLIEREYGTDKGIPQLIMAGASVDDVFVIVMFTAFIGLAQGKHISPVGFLQIPVSIITGMSLGILFGLVLSHIFKKITIRDSAKVIILLSISFLFVAVEDFSFIPFSGLLAVMGMGAALQKRRVTVAQRLSNKFSKLWVGAEILLFVLIGATVDLKYALSAGAAAVTVVFCVLIFRMIGVFCCLLKTKLSIQERIFCMIAYMPKATVQAAIGSIPLALGLSCGDIVVTVAVLAIMITAPLGALGIDLTYTYFLNKEKKEKVVDF